MQKEDFARVPGLSLKDYHELEPYITIAADFQQASLYVKSAKKDTLHHAIPQKLKEGETIDLANADTTMLKRVPGIGSHFARKIAEHRQRLGGFVSVDQLDDIEMFPTEAKRYFTLTAGNNVKRININQMSLKELRQHPYLNYYQARTITEMRRKNGPLKSLDELRLSPYFPDEVRQRLAPYVEF
jgi:DNA uptake protein ComE-like DNA-binding protein